MQKLSLRKLLALPAAEWRITVPTLITLLRIVLIPFIVYAMTRYYWGVALFLFILAAISDALDGALARLTYAQTFLGAALDPIADKLLMLSAFITLAFCQSSLCVIPQWFVRMMIAKDIALVVGVLFFLLRDGFIKLAPTVLSKLTTLVQMCFIAWLFACYYFHWAPIKTYYVMLSVVTLLAAGSFVQYAHIAWSLCWSYHKKVAI